MTNPLAAILNAHEEGGYKHLIHSLGLAPDFQVQTSYVNHHNRILKTKYIHA